MAQIKFTEQAINDLEDIADFIGSGSPYYASLQVQKILNERKYLKIFLTMAVLFRN